MAIFDRIRRSRRAQAEPAASLIPEHLLPEVNQRVTIATSGTAPVSSRVEDVRPNMIQLAFPALDLEFSDAVTITWEREGIWFSLETQVTGMDRGAAVPTLLVSAAGRLARYDERRLDTPRALELPLELRVVRARSIRTGRELHTHTTQVGADIVRFMTTATFAPGDLFEVTLHVDESQRDAIRARMRVIRMDTVPGEWRSTCTATFDEVLRSDRARLMAFAAATGIETTSIQPVADTDDQVHATDPTTADGVGGRDEPRSLSDLQGVLDWLAKDRAQRDQRTQPPTE